MMQDWKLIEAYFSSLALPDTSRRIATPNFVKSKQQSQ